MKNWAGNLEFHPKKEVSPTSTDEVKAIVQSALRNNEKIRIRGSGHSWTGLIATDSIYMHLDQMQGLVSAEKDKNLVTVKAGTKLYRFGEIGFSHGLAMENQGDINLQSVAGATSTGTHGTGITLQSVANQIAKVTLVNGHGEVVSFDETHPEFNGARLSLGCLGIITELTFRLKDCYKLKVETFAEDFKDALSAFDERLKKHRHLEMFYFPVGDWSLTKFMNLSDEEPTPRTFLKKMNEKVIENWLYTQLNRVAASSGRYKLIDKIMQTFVSREVSIDWSHRAFPTERSFKFMEMEYNLPVEKFREAMEEIRASIKKHNFQTLFPIEIRFVKGDDIWLSPAYQRDSVYFAVHTYISEDYRPYFACMEEIFKKHGGRPHWGKMHSLKKNDLQKVYPRLGDFEKLREKHDPMGVFLNPHLKDIFGL